MEHGAANPPGHGFTIGVILLRPESAGSIMLKSNDARAHPSIRPNYLSAPNDVTALVAGLRFARRVAGAPPFDPYRGDEVWPGIDTQSDEALTNFIREKAETLYHPVGTCRMGSDALAVVDDRLRVRGRREASGRRRLHHADHHRRPYQCAGDHDRREGGGSYGGCPVAAFLPSRTRYARRRRAVWS